MSYIRILPRDAFNEANLLKCIGKLSLLVTDNLIKGLSLEYENGAFDIAQDPGDGSISVRNITFWYNDRILHFSRPINSRQLWPLYLETGQDSYRVFDEQGNYILKLAEIEELNQ